MIQTLEDWEIVSVVLYYSEYTMYMDKILVNTTVLFSVWFFTLGVCPFHQEELVKCHLQKFQFCRAGVGVQEAELPMSFHRV